MKYSGIKFKLFKRLFPAYACDYMHNEEMLDKLIKEINTYKQKIYIYNQYSKNINAILSERHLLLLNIKHNKREQPMVVYLEVEDPGQEYNILIYDLETYSIDNYSWVYKLEFRLCNNKKRIFIYDNHSKIENIGNASIGLEQLIKFAELMGVREITGEITWNDWDHVSKLEHLYKKFGFAVDLDYTLRQGDILWQNKKYV